MGAVYGAVGLTRDPALATINVTFRDCNDQPIDGVVVTFTPAPAAVAYTDGTGMPSRTQPSTAPPYDLALAMNAPIMSTTITATAPGFVFHDFVIGAFGSGDSILVLMHGAPQ